MEESLERLRLRIRLTEMMLEKRERAYQESTVNGTELQRMMRLKKYHDTANDLQRLKSIEERMMRNGAQESV